MISQNSIIDNYLKDRFSKLYPDMDINTIDSELLENILENIAYDDSKKIISIENDMYNKINQSNDNIQLKTIGANNNNNNNNNNIQNNNLTQKNKPNEFVKQNIMMADDIIPEMSLSSNLIYLKGKLNGIPIKIMVDTGASSCVIFKSVVEKCGLDYLVDSSTSIMIQGAHGMKPTLGTLWYFEVEIDISPDKNNLSDNKNNKKNTSVSIPIGAEIIDDSETIKANKIIQEHMKKIDELIGNTNNLPKKDLNSHDFDIIFGMTFLKSYRANIDFFSMTLTLNNNIKIKFN